MDYSIKQLNEREKEEFLKARTDSLFLPKNIKNALQQSDIRTVRGLISKSRSELKKRFAFNKEDYDAITVSLDNLIVGLFGHELKTHQIKESKPAVVTNTQVLNKNEVDNIINLFASFFDIDKQFLIGKDRRQDTVIARDIIVYILRVHGGMSFPAIGRLLGGRDHTTIIHAYSKIERKVKNNREFEEDFSSLIEEAKKFKESTLASEKASQSIMKHFSSSSSYFEKASLPIQIPQRNQKILDLYRQGFVLEDIGKKIGVTRERARQIIVKTIKQMAFNESLKTGIKVEFDTLMASEKESRRLLIESKKPKKQPKLPKVYRWSVFYDACKECGTTETKHYKYGLCEVCGNRSIVGPAREKMILEHDNKCDICGKTREQSYEDHGRDFYLIRKSESVYCRGCFLEEMGKKLADSRKNRWRMFYN